ncbi:precorrin-6Y C5,15-methyltransferase (decarboxylating) subunit CbiT [Methanobrevibacter sp. OttesenSCG-928-I08]|nr:precorrin-6Y C5,15-methyltransferase (decarboxylating) subunit CbiT [Methanobrevibacter sp. OttesenSCG-928-I08]
MINDDDFIKSCDVPGPTKENIRAILLYKSMVQKEDIVVDIGCGTGGISVEFAKRAKKVIAIDKNPEAISITRQNLKKFNVSEKVQLIEDDGLSTIKNIDNIDIAIVGGSGNDLEEILEVIHNKLNPNGRIFITAILLDTKVQGINKLKSLGYNPKLVEINISNGRILDRGVMMISENPIAIISAKKR